MELLYAKRRDQIASHVTIEGGNLWGAANAPDLS
jgi:hypothetical protein